jgi:hypothetical protein
VYLLNSCQVPIAVVAAWAGHADADTTEKPSSEEDGISCMEGQTVAGTLRPSADGTTLRLMAD